MKAICIDGNPKVEASIYIPEGIPLNVWIVSSDPDFYWVEGYMWCPVSQSLVMWHRRRFVPLSDIDETKLQNKKEAVVV